MYEIRPARRGKAYHRRLSYGFPLGFVPLLVVLGFVALALSGPYVTFFPLVPLFFVFVFFVGPALGRSMARVSINRDPGPRAARPDPNRREKELLRALERHVEVTAARAAMETSLSVAEAEEMLAKLASGGHVEVHASGGAIAYALRPADRRGAGDREITDGSEPPTEGSEG